MKRKSSFHRRGGPSASAAEPEALAARAFGAIAADPERLGRFLAVTGLDPSAIRRAAAEHGFLPSVLDYVVGDEALLLELAREIDVAPEALAAAHARLSPEPDWAA